MLRFILHKLLNKRWMALCLLVGNILMVAISASNPLYSNAVLQKTLTQDLSDAITEDGVNPAAFSMMTNISKSSVTQESVDRLHQAAEDAANLPKAMHMPSLMFTEDHYVSSIKTMSLMGRRTDTQQLSLGKRVDIADNIELMNGRMYSGELVNGDTIEVLVSERMMKQYDLLVGDTLELTNVYTDSSQQKNYKVSVVGVFRAKEGSELYWSRSSLMLCSYLVMDEGLFDELFIAGGTYPYGIASWWYASLDYTKLNRNDVPEVIEAIEEYQDKYEATFRQNLLPYIENYASNAQQLNATLLILQTPILVLVCAFIFMVSRQLIELEENEIAVIKSRGAYKKQILQLYLLQGGLLSGAGLVLGIPLGFLICSLLGASNSFLEFVRRSSLPVSITWETVLFAVGAALIACGTMVVPAIRHANVSIVSHKVSKQRKNALPWWQKCFVDVILIVVSLYSIRAYNDYRSQMDVLLSTDSVRQLDLLLYFSSSLFIIGVGLLGIRIMPYIIRLVFFLFRKKWSPALYTSFQRVIRTRNSQTFIMLFLVLTIALGIFNADTARSVNSNNEEQIYYTNGCDVRLLEKTANDSTLAGSAPQLEVYRELEGVNAATRVFVSESATAQYAKENKSIRTNVMGIESKEFGETAWFKTSLLDQHWYRYLNALTCSPDAVLLSSNYQTAYGYKVGDSLTYRISGTEFTGTIYGFVDYWPGYISYYTTIDNETGLATNKDQFLIVSNLNYMESMAGSLSCEIWMDFEDSSSSIYTYASENNIYFASFSDANANLIDLKNTPVLQGTNGILTTNFIVILLLCTVGFLIYWILSIQSRTLQFGIFRAMGMSMREIITMLIGEQVLISGTAIGIGFVAGVLSSRIFVPLVQSAYLPEQQYIPMEPVSMVSDMVRLGVVVGLMILVCLCVIGWIVSKIRISQALKLGED